MKSFNPAELQAAAEVLTEQLQGAQLQEVHMGPKGPYLSFWRQGNFHLYFDLSPLSPLVLLFEDKVPFRRDKKVKPAMLFLKSHGVNKLFESASVDPAKGRVLDLTLRGYDSICSIEVRLFPHGQNFTVESAGKEVSWSKPKELTVSTEEQGGYDVVRTLYDLREEWVRTQAPKQQHEEKLQSNLADTLKKKKRAIKKIEQELEKRQQQRWYDVGQLLLEKQQLNIDSEELDLDTYIDRSRDLAWNIENCFAKSKEGKKKIGNLESRLASLKDEYQAFERGELKPVGAKQNSPSTGAQYMKKLGAKGRKLSLGEGADAIVGKSAKDNLMLLRRAQAWDLWLHLRDFPGAHAIIRRGRGREVRDSEIKEVSQWLIRESMAGRQLLSGEAYQVVVAECRYVRPIKGDKLGRVTYQNEKSYRFEV